MKIALYLSCLALIATPTYASTSYFHDLVRIKPVVTEQRILFVTADTVTDIYSNPLMHNIRTKNRSINICLMAINLPVTATPPKKLQCTNAVNWTYKSDPGLPDIALDFIAKKIFNPKKICEKTSVHCTTIESFASGSVFFGEDVVSLVRNNEHDISYSFNLRSALKLEEPRTYVEELSYVLNAQLSDDGKRVYFFRKPHSEWEDNLKTVNNKTYYVLSIAENLLTQHSIALSSDREFIESIHEFNGNPQFLISRVDQSGTKKSQYLLGNPKVTFQDYEFARDYSPLTNSVFTLTRGGENSKTIVSLEEKNHEGVAKTLQLKL